MQALRQPLGHHQLVGDSWILLVGQQSLTDECMVYMPVNQLFPEHFHMNDDNEQCVGTVYSVLYV